MTFKPETAKITGKESKNAKTLPQAFWYHFDFAETKEALKIMAKFFDERVGR